MGGTHGVHVQRFHQQYVFLHLFFGDGTPVQWAVVVAVDTFEKRRFAVNQQLPVFGELYFAEAYFHAAQVRHFPFLLQGKGQVVEVGSFGSPFQWVLYVELQVVATRLGTDRAGEHFLSRRVGELD